MTTWQGWVARFIAVATVPDTPENHRFFTEWAKYDGNSCNNNPVLISLPISGSSNCRELPGDRTRRSQNYSSHAQAAGQFRAQLRSGRYPHLVAALESGDPFDLSDEDAGKVSSDLSKWGGAVFPHHYLTGVFKGSGDVNAPKAHHGWAALRHSFNHKMPQELKASQHSTDAALRALSRARKVRL
jgi:hypothetical protein